MKKKFELNKSSKIYLSIILLLMVALSIIPIINNSGISSYEAGKIFGRIIGVITFPLLIAWIVWKLSGKKDNIGNIVFKIILILMLLGNTIGMKDSNELYKKNKINNLIAELENSKNNFKKSILESNTNEQYYLSYKKYVSSIINSLDKISEMSSREEQRGFKILKKILKNDIESSKNWHESINKISEARMFDFSLLKNKNEFDYQKKVVNAYIKENNLYRKRVLTYQEELIKELKSKNIDMNSNFMKGLISGINKSFIKKIPLLKKLINEHIRHGNNMILLLELLEKNKDIWEYKNNQIEINDDKILKEYGVLIKTISINREKIDILAKEITESL